MYESKYRRMQRLPFQRNRSVSPSINRVSGKRMPNIFHMYANLMRPACFQLQLNMYNRRIAPAQQNALPHVCFAFSNGKQLAVIRITADRRINRSLFMREIAMYKSDIFASNGVFLQLLGK